LKPSTEFKKKLGAFPGGLGPPGKGKNAKFFDF
jgi:hypothetical protein